MKILVFLVSLCVLTEPQAYSQQVFPAELHLMPTLITLQTSNSISYGTGVFLTKSNRIFLVTAAHCLFDPQSTNPSQLISPSGKISSFGRKDSEASRAQGVIKCDLKQLQDDGRIKRYPMHDIAVAYIADQLTNGTRCVAGAWFEDDSGQFLFCAEGTWINFTNVPEGNETLILGYPVELLKPELQWAKSVLESDIDFSCPLIRRGIISQKNRLNRRLIIDSGVYGGNSGGPVVVVQHPTLDTTTFKIAGIITQFVPSQTRVVPQVGLTNSVLVNSGYGVAEPIDYALELMDTFK